MIAATPFRTRLEDPGGEPLDRLLGKPLEVTQFLHIAIPLVAAIRQMHERGLIQRVIGDRVQLQQVATRLAQEGFVVFVPSFIEETDAGAEASGAPTQDFAHISSAAINQGGRNDALLRWVILELVGKDRSRLREATPLFRASARSGPMYMANSLGEFVPPESAIKMQRALAGMGVESIVQLVPGTAHAKGFTDSAIGGSLAFLRRVLA